LLVTAPRSSALLFGALVGVALAVIFTWSAADQPGAAAAVLTLNMIPKVALGPLFIVWFSYGILPNILIAFSICFFPILLTTARASRGRARSARSGEIAARLAWTLFRKIQLPGALPTCSRA